MFFKRKGFHSSILTKTGRGCVFIHDPAQQTILNTLLGQVFILMRRRNWNQSLLKIYFFNFFNIACTSSIIVKLWLTRSDQINFIERYCMGLFLPSNSLFKLLFNIDPSLLLLARCCHIVPFETHS